MVRNVAHSSKGQGCVLQQVDLVLASVAIITWHYTEQGQIPFGWLLKKESVLNWILEAIKLKSDMPAVQMPSHSADAADTTHSQPTEEAPAKITRRMIGREVPIGRLYVAQHPHVNQMFVCESNRVIDLFSKEHNFIDAPIKMVVNIGHYFIKSEKLLDLWFWSEWEEAPLSEKHIPSLKRAKLGRTFYGIKN